MHSVDNNCNIYEDLIIIFRLKIITNKTINSKINLNIFILHYLFYNIFFCLLGLIPKTLCMYASVVRTGRLRTFGARVFPKNIWNISSTAAKISTRIFIDETSLG